MSKPRELDVENFVRERVNEIADLLEVVDNHELPAGEVAQGPRTFIQRLPRHMRRRAMSHNVKRLPRRQRHLAQRRAALTQHRNKPPSRYHRRRPSNLLQEYARRRRRVQWLETHIWHAKRFHMVDAWGWRVAERSCQRGHRAAYRDATSRCTIQDISYTAVLQVSGPLPTLLDALRPLCCQLASATFACRWPTDGQAAIDLLLYKPNAYPADCIGPASLLWRPPHSDDGAADRTFWLTVHPSISQQVLSAMIQVLEVQPIDATVEPSRFGGERGVSLVVRRDLCRFRLTGPLSSSILASLCSPIASDVLDDCSTDWLANFRSDNGHLLNRQAADWADASHCRPAQLFNGRAFAVLAPDPRLDLCRRQPTPAEPPSTAAPPSSVAPVSPLWCEQSVEQMKALKRADHVLNELRRNRLLKTPQLRPSSAADVVPLLLLCRSTSAPIGSGWDVLLPAGWAMPFWIAFQYSTCRPIGLKEARAIAFEVSDFSHPDDWPDTDAGRSVAAAEAAALAIVHSRRPHNRRLNHWSKLRIKHPFAFAWQELIDGWRQRLPANDNCGRYYVLRDRKLLRRLSELMAGKRNALSLAQLDKLLEGHVASALVAVTLDSAGKGRPRRRALICLADGADFQQTPTTAHRAAPVMEAAVCEPEPPNNRPASPLANFIALDDDVEVPLDALIVDAHSARSEQRKLKRKQKRQAAAARKKGGAAGAATSACDGLAADFSEDVAVNVADSCCRTVCGLVVRGDCSFVRANGHALGYCSLAALLQLLRDRQAASRAPVRALFRNTSSAAYRLAVIRLAV